MSPGWYDQARIRLIALKRIVFVICVVYPGLDYSMRQRKPDLDLHQVVIYLGYNSDISCTFVTVFGMKTESFDK